jgi:hypothetical protein
VIREQTPGLDLFIDPDAMSESSLEQAKRRLTEALAVLNLRTG